jgi:hypothetical protein
MVSEVGFIGLIGLDSRLYWIVVSPYYENGTNDGTPGGQDGFQQRQDES